MASAIVRTAPGGFAAVFLAGGLLGYFAALDARGPGISVASLPSPRILSGHEEHSSHEHSEDDGQATEEDEHGGGEHGGSGGHGGESHGHGGHHLVVDDISFTVSVMLFMFLCVDMVLLYFVNSTDANIRQFAWSMLGTTISIFCAVLLNEAVRSFFLEQILPSPFPRGFNIHVGHREHILVASFVFTCCFTTLSFAGWLLHDNHRYLFAVKGIGGHITGFAFIAAGGHWQEVCSENFGVVALVTLSFFFVAALLRVCSFWARSRYAPTPENLRGSADADEWTEMVVEGEDEAFALAIGFLVTQVILFNITGILQPMHGVTKNHTMEEVHHLFAWVLVFVVVLVILSWSRSQLNKERESIEVGGCTAERVVSFSQHLSAFIASWLLLKAFEWMMSIVFKNMALGMMVNAFVVTLISIFAILILDRWADKLQKDEVDQPTENPVVAGVDEEEQPSYTRDNSGASRGSREGSRHLHSTVVGVAQMFHGEALDKSNHARALRTIMEAFSFLTGLSWEKAFDSANATLVVGVPSFSHHRVLSKVGISVSLVCLVLPAWLWYVVPKAMKGWKWHRDNINKERGDRLRDRTYTFSSVPLSNPNK